MKTFSLNHIETLEAEAISILRNVFSEFENPVLLYSVGKDSSVLLHLSRKAFYPAPVPFPLMHVDTAKKFEEMYSFREVIFACPDIKSIVWKTAEFFSPFEVGIQQCCANLKTKALLDAISHYKFDAAISGARREEERSRAKERIYSFRDDHGQWNPKKQRPEIWQMCNSKLAPRESMRVFPLSNWTELDIWHYISLHKIAVVPLYFAKKRNVLLRDGQYLLLGNEVIPAKHEQVETVSCRFRTLGCYPCTGAVRSNATTVDEIIEELRQSNSSERATRTIDHDVDASMERKKREGYF